MIIKKVKITPKRAGQWLDKNFDRNRKLRAGHVKKLASDMAQKRWHDTGETIKFNTSGFLIDGQHRLSAIIEAGVTVEMYVAYDVEDIATKVIDTGASRSTADILSIQGVQGNTKHLATLARRALSWKRNNDGTVLGRGFKARQGVTNQDILEFVNQVDLIPHLRFSYRAVSACVSPGMLSQGDWAILHYIFSQIDQAAAEDFLMKLAQLDGVPMQHPIRELFKRLNYQVEIPSRVRMKFCLIAWNAWRRGDRSVTLKIRQVDENPIPELI